MNIFRRGGAKSGCPDVFIIKTKKAEYYYAEPFPSMDMLICHYKLDVVKKDKKYIKDYDITTNITYKFNFKKFKILKVMNSNIEVNHVKLHEIK